MKTIDSILAAISADSQLSDLIIKSKSFDEKIKPKNILDDFWTSIDGIKFKSILESKYNLNLSSSIVKGKIKSAVLLFIARVV